MFYGTFHDGFDWTLCKTPIGCTRIKKKKKTEEAEKTVFTLCFISYPHFYICSKALKYISNKQELNFLLWVHFPSAVSSSKIPVKNRLQKHDQTLFIFQPNNWDIMQTTKFNVDHSLSTSIRDIKSPTRISKTIRYIYTDKSRTQTLADRLCFSCTFHWLA